MATRLPHFIQSSNLSLVTRLAVQHMDGGEKKGLFSILKPRKFPVALSLHQGSRVLDLAKRPFRSSAGLDVSFGVGTRGVVGGGGGELQGNATIIPMRRSSVDDLRSCMNPTGLASKVNILVSIQSHPSLSNHNSGAPGDLRILCNTLREELVDPNVFTTVVTDCSETGEWLPDHRAKVNIVPPTLANLMSVIQSAAVMLKPGGTCLIWFGGFGGSRPGSDGTPRRVLFMADPQEVISGPDLRSWLMGFDLSTTVQVCLDACQAGRFLGLAYYFDARGRLVDSQQPSAAKDGPRIVCVAACHPGEFAHIVLSDRGVAYGGLAWYLPRYIDQALGRAFLKDIERQIKPLLSDPEGKWIQRPHVEMSYRDEDATFSLATLPKPPPRPAAPHRD